MYIIKFIKLPQTYEMLIFDDLLRLLAEHRSEDLSEMNFYIQTTQKKFEFKDVLLIIHDKINNSVDLKRIEGDVFLANY
ncbi:MAG: hypothetical protein MRJ93_01805 [Nitrososphaeraceae archaeon]|nr:hypothetical protein [Nitrososphaeraceae archaeon]